MARWPAVAALLLAVLATAHAEAGVGHDPDPPDHLDAPVRRAVIVGIDEYDDERLNPLRYTVHDAEALTDVLHDPRRGQFLTRVVSHRCELAAFWAHFHAAARASRPRDTLLIYFSGHGSLRVADRQEPYLLFSDSELDDLPGTALSLTELEEALAQVPAQRKVLIVDSCFSGTDKSVYPEETRSILDSLRGAEPPRVERDLGRMTAMLFASGYHQGAREAAELEHGVFTHYLLQALRGEGDLDGDGLVDVFEAFDHACTHTIAATDGAQVPWKKVESHGVARLYLAGDEAHRQRAEVALVTGLEVLAEAEALLVDGVPRGPGAVALAPGRHTIEIRDGDRTRLARVDTLERGERLDLGVVLREQRRAEDIQRRLRAAWRRDRVILIGGGPALSLTHDVVSHLHGAAELWLLSPRLGPGRLGVGARATLGYGDLAGFGAFPTGLLAVRGAYSFAVVGPLTVGPTLEGGEFWRLGAERLDDEPRMQAGPFLAPGVMVRLLGPRGFVSFHAACGVGPVEVELAGGLEPRPLPLLSLTAGARL